MLLRAVLSSSSFRRITIFFKLREKLHEATSRAFMYLQTRPKIIQRTIWEYLFCCWKLLMYSQYILTRNSPLCYSVSCIYTRFSIQAWSYLRLSKSERRSWRFFLLEAEVESDLSWSHRTIQSFRLRWWACWGSDQSPDYKSGHTHFICSSSYSKLSFRWHGNWPKFLLYDCFLILL